MPLIDKEFANTYSEKHSFVIGFYQGFKDLKPNGIDTDMLKNPDVKKEIHYANGGYLLGYLAKLILILLVGREFFL